MLAYRDLDPPAEYAELSAAERTALLSWIAEYISPRKTPNKRTSYGIKHAFEASTGGFYVSNGAFKGAMLAAGYEPVCPEELNWRFRISTRKVVWS
ncbi:MAG: hypothetical protein H0V53_09380 [Rubrobacter sp.]|jgi:hypothetical protein|nr:hypothetical protein [Rubrobacter sp.]